MTTQPRPSPTSTERSDGDSEQPFASTRWQWKLVTMSRAPQASNSAPKALRWRRLPARNPRKPLTCQVSWRGGAEAWVEIHTRGDIGRFPGHTPIADIVLMMNSQRYGDTGG